MVKKLQVLLLGLGIILSGSVLAQNKKLMHNANRTRAAKVKDTHRGMKVSKKSPLFTKSTLFSEDFNNGIDTTWRMVDVDGDGWNWYFDSFHGAMASYSYDTVNYDALYPNNYLITPQISIPAGGAILSYSTFSIDAYYPDQYSILVSPSGSDNVDSFTVSLVVDSIAPDIPTTYTFPLGAFVGQQIRLAFVHDDVDEWGIVIDDVEVYTPDSVELAVVSADLLGTVAASNNVSINARIMNNGGTALSNVAVHCSVNGTPYTATLASLPGQQSATATFTGIDMSSVGTTYNVKIYVHDPADNNQNNDTINLTTVALPAPSITWDFEGDTNLPAGFTAVSYDGATAYSTGFFPNNEPWTVFDDSNYGYMEDTPYPEGGTNCAMAESWFDEEGVQANRWLITPRITLTSSNYILWDAMSQDDEYLETYRVRISTTNTDTASFTVLTTINSEEGVWKRRYLDLSAYAGQTVSIAFQLVSFDMFRLLVDNIKILGSATIAGDEPPVGLEQASNEVRLYPNPTTGRITIDAQNITRIEVIDAMGRVAMTQEGNANTMNISSLAEGVYTLRIVTENGVSMKHVVKK